MAIEPAPQTSPADEKRGYHSTLRRRQAEQTRARVLEAARRLFIEHGWSATGVRDIASRAGVSVKTVYDNFGSKGELFKTVVDVAVVGDDEPVALMERAEFAALAEGDLVERAERGAHLAAAVNERTVELQPVWHVAADTDPGVAESLETALAQRRQTAVAALDLVAGHQLDRREAEGLAAIVGVEVYGLLVRDGGWTDEEYESWLAEVVVRQLGPEHPSSSAPRYRRRARRLWGDTEAARVPALPATTTAPQP